MTLLMLFLISVGRLFPRYMHLGFWRCFFLFLVAKGVCYIFGFDLIHLLSSSNIAVDPMKRGETSVSGRERSRLRMSIFVDQEFQEHERSATCVAQCFRTVRQQQVAFETFLQIISSSSFLLSYEFSGSNGRLIQLQHTALKVLFH